MTSSISRRAPAKINLVLSVGPAQPPKGYHPIVSWMAPVSLADEVVLERLGDGGESEYFIDWAEDAPRASEIDWPLEKDLGVRAHRLLERHIGRALPVRMEVRKRIPVGGGLGGGSSDAAAVLMGVNELFELHLGEAVLVQFAGVLGSDVAFFVDEAGGRSGAGGPRPAIVSGYGERIERVALVPGEVVLIFPPFGCATGAVYGAFDRPEPGAVRAGLREAQVRQVVSMAVGAHRINGAQLFNDLAAPAQAVEPRLAEVRLAAREVLRTPVHVTGSGSTLFAVLDGAGPTEAERQAELVRERVKGVAAAAVSLC